jgi:hypothetical protein
MGFWGGLGPVAEVSQILTYIYKYYIISSICDIFIMPQDELLSLFPTPVLIAQYPMPYEKELDYIRAMTCRRENKGGDKTNVIHYNRQSEDTFVLDKPELSNVRAFIESKIHKFVTEVMSSDNHIIIEYLPTEDMTSDILTKALGR